MIKTEKTDMKIQSDWINHPKHYTQGKYECSDVIYDVLSNKSPEIDSGIFWAIGNAIKYLWRCGNKEGDYGKSRKEKAIEDLEKAVWYLNFAITKAKEGLHKNE